jgi:hypothetical protein
MKDLTVRDIEVLQTVVSVTRQMEKIGVATWRQAIDFGGTNGSHHSYTLHKLHRRGLIEMKKIGGRREKGSCHYRSNLTGERFLEKVYATRLKEDKAQ